MRAPFIPKTWPSPGGNPNCRTSPEGALTILTAFLFFIFGTLGLSMLFITQIAVKTSGYKRNMILLDQAAENGIKQGFQDLMDRISQNSFPIPLSPDEFDSLSRDIQDQGDLVMELISDAKEMIPSSGQEENLKWESETYFKRRSIAEEASHIHADFDIEIISQGNLINFSQTSISQLECHMDVLLGYLPLPVLPLLLDGDKDAEKNEEFFRKNRVSFASDRDEYLKDRILYSDKNLLPKNADALLEKALKVKFFDPSELTVQQIRQALGLEISTEPVPEGVYLIKDDLGLGGIYIEGGVDSLALSIEGCYQVINFLKEERRWKLRFSPSLSKTEFQSPEHIEIYELIPRGIIIVNGPIMSLSGSSSDDPGFSDTDTSNILTGINLSILSPDTITITSSLMYQGVTWLEDIPYLKDCDTQLNIFAPGKDLFSNSKRDGHIVLTDNTATHINVHGSLISSGKGITVNGTQKQIQILGGIQSTSIQASDCEIEIIPDGRYLTHQDYLMDSPVTALPVLHLASLRPKGWKDI